MRRSSDWRTFYFMREKEGNLMYRSIYSLNMDTELRRDMEEVCKEMGISLNTALVLFMKKVVRDRKIPF